MKAGYPVTVLTTLLDGYRDASYPHLNTARFVSLPPRSVHRSIKSVARELSFAHDVHRVLSNDSMRSNIDCVLFHPSTVAWSLFQALKPGVPTVYVAHSSIEAYRRAGVNPYPPLMTALLRLSERIAIRRSTAVIAISEFMKRELVRIRGHQQGILTLPNPVDLDRFKPSDSERLIDLLFVGRLSVEKGLDDLFTASRLWPSGLQCTLAGDGPLKSRIQARIKQHRLPFQVVGYQPHHEISRLFQTARLFVFPARVEPQGIAMMEALACGVPVIGARSGAIPETVRHGVNGRLYSPGDPETLAAYIAELQSAESYNRIQQNTRSSILHRCRNQFETRLLDMMSQILHPAGMETHQPCPQPTLPGEKQIP